MMSVSKHAILARREMVLDIEKRLAPAFLRHTVILARTPIRWDDHPGTGLGFLQGSGTLVRVDANDSQRYYGVLTCGHVLGEFSRKRIGTVTGSLTLLIPATAAGPESPPYFATVPYAKELAVIEGASNTDSGGSGGPDLGWLPLTLEQAHSIQTNARSRSVFYDYAKGLRIRDMYKNKYRKQGDRNSTDYLSHHMNMAVGWNYEIHKRSDGRKGGIWMNEVLPENLSAKDGWLYRDFRIDDERWVERSYNDGTMLPTSWGGLSGGSVWHVWRSERTVDRYEKMLVGVPFFQISQPSQRSMTIRAHYDLSLLRILQRAGIAPRGSLTENGIIDALRDLDPPADLNE